LNHHSQQILNPGVGSFPHLNRWTQSGDVSKQRIK
jgi:hypothetical protein